MPPRPNRPTQVYALLLLLGGAAGRVTAGSNASLVSGLVLGAYFNWASDGDTFRRFKQLHIAVAAFVAAFMYTRYRAAGKFMPAGLVSLLSALAAGNAIIA